MKIKGDKAWKRVHRGATTLIFILGVSSLYLASLAEASHHGPRHSILERRDNWSDFVGLWKYWSKNGQRLVDIEVAKEGGKLWYNGIFVPGSGGHALYQYNNFDSFVDRFKKLHSDGLKLVDLDVITVGSKKLYTGVWRKASHGQYLYCYDNWGDFTDKWDDLSDQNKRLIDVDVESVLVGVSGPGPRRVLKLTQSYCGIWKSGTGGYRLYKMGWSSFRKKWADLRKSGYRLIDVGTSVEGGVIQYTGAWRAERGSSALYRYDTFVGINNKWGELDAKGYRMIDLESVQLNSKTYYTGVWSR